MRKGYQVQRHTPVIPALKTTGLEVHRFKASEAKPGVPLPPSKGGTPNLLAVTAADRRIQFL